MTRKDERGITGALFGPALRFVAVLAVVWMAGGCATLPGQDDGESMVGKRVTVETSDGTIEFDVSAAEDGVLRGTTPDGAPVELRVEDVAEVAVVSEPDANDGDRKVVRNTLLAAGGIVAALYAFGILSLLHAFGVF